MRRIVPPSKSQDRVSAAQVTAKSGTSGLRRLESGLLPAVVVLSALVLWAPWPFGSITPWAAALVAGGCLLGLVATCVGGARPADLRPALAPAGLLAALAVLGLLQAVAWPAAFSAGVSGEHAELAATAASAVGEADSPERISLSVAPARSVRAALLLLALAAGLAAAVVVGRPRPGRRWIAAALGAAALGQLFFGVPRWFAGSRTLWGAEVGGSGRLRGSFVNPNHFALFLEIALAVAFAWTFWAFRRALRERVPERKVLLLAPPVLAWVVLFIGIAFSGSRAGLVAALAGTVVQGFLVAAASRRGSRLRRLGVGLSGTALAAAGVAAVVFVGFEQGLGRLAGTSVFDVTWSARLSVYGATLDLWQRFPWTGSGLGTFIDAFPLVEPPGLGEVWRHAHNDFLEVLATVGVLGALLVLTGMVWIAIRLARLLRHGRRSEDRAAALAALGALAVASVHEALDFGLTMPANAVALTLVVGVALGASGASAAAPAGGREGASAVGRIAVLGVALVACAVGAGVVWSHSDLRAERRTLVHRARGLGLGDDPLVTKGLRRAEDPGRARAQLGRVLLTAALHPSGESPDREQLAAARSVSREALAARPASWDAALTLGAATYLLWSSERDPRLLQDYRAWELPLLLARRLAPGRREPERYLATAYLELWPALSEDKRDFAKRLVAHAFEEPRMFDRLVEPWLRIAAQEPERLEVLPPDPRAWRRLRGLLAREGDWEGVCAAWERERAATRDRLAGRIDEAARRLAGGELREARGMLLGLVVEARPDRQLAPVIERALAIAPHGPGSTRRARAAREWLEWSLELCAIDRCPLAAPAIERLAAELLSFTEVDTEDAALAAWARLTTGDRRGAARLERRSRTPWSDAWGPYLAEKAGLLAAEGRSEEAEETLRAVAVRWDGHPAVRRARTALDGGKGIAGAPAVATGSGSGWPASAWNWPGEGEVAQLALEAPEGEASLALELTAPSAGAAVAVRWDGATVGCYPVRSQRRLRPGIVVDRGAHLLELERIEGGEVWPGAVALVGTGGGAEAGSR